ncbi:ABC transporter ATP-binding protein [Roseomonas sp. 18066]|uniref:ABC transporter ATP-binding protein n=1 Tax=Roseomonas sp. 18066 TaxID=2681412 RepID=UPI00135C2740|nr:ABC transporter ATP-binding protein [Roseomonas sp. 18066]
MADLLIEGLARRFGPVAAVDDLSLHVADGEFVTLLGPSGCGKSTTLAAVAGLDQPDAGRIVVGGKTYFDGARGIYLPPEARGCGLVFQSYALWPHMTVFDNVAFPLTLRRVRAAERRRRVEEVLALVEMEAFAGRHPHMLSGGQQQRVALARTLVYQPSILLLDEPLSNLDAKLRDRARSWLAALRLRLGLTTLYVTHDQIEALSLSDRVVVMNRGRIAQLGTPRAIYEAPAEAFVADFIGTTNFLPARVLAEAAGEARLALEDGQQVSVAVPRPPGAGRAVTLAARPEQLRLAEPGEASDAHGTVVTARLRGSAYIGGRWQLGLELGGSTLRVETTTLPDDAGGDLRLWLPRDGLLLFPAAA